MTKKLIALMMALVLCLCATVSFAAGSKDTGDVVGTNDPTITVTAPTAESKAELDAIAEFVNSGKPVIEYFDESVHSAIDAVLPTDVNKADLKMDEFFTVASDAAIAAPTSLTLNTAATYKNTDAVVVMGGVFDGEKYVWQVIPCTIVDGKIVVSLPADFCAHIADGSTVLSVLSSVQ